MVTVRLFLQTASNNPYNSTPWPVPPHHMAISALSFPTPTKCVSLIRAPAHSHRHAVRRTRRTDTRFASWLYEAARLCFIN